MYYVSDDYNSGLVSNDKKRFDHLSSGVWLRFWVLSVDSNPDSLYQPRQPPGEC